MCRQQQLNEWVKSDCKPTNRCPPHARLIFLLAAVVVAAFFLEGTEINLINSFRPSFTSRHGIDASQLELPERGYNKETQSRTESLSIRTNEWPMNLPDLPDTFRNDTQHRISSIYSTEALSQLDRIKAKLFRGDPVTVVMNGASSSAGGGDIPYDDRFFNQMVKRLEHDYPKANITTVDASHGGRTTLHSAHLMHSFFPPDMDIVIWEFSINDGWKMNLTDGHSDTDVRNSLIQWLRNLESMQKDPPLVIMVYLWQTPFSQNEDGTIANRIFDLHKLLAAEYDFVLGHVNLASYFDSLQWDYLRLNATFLADYHHPATLTHHVLGDLLYKFVSHAGSMSPIRNGTFAAMNRTDFTWVCLGDTKSPRAIKELFSLTGGVVQGSFTPDLPRNKVSDAPGTLIPRGNLTIQQFGKAHPIRHDRQLAILLPCCSSNTTSLESISFDIGNDRYIHALELTLRVTRERKPDVQIIYDGMQDDSSVPTKIIRPGDWQCILGDDFVMIERNVSTLGFCDSKCNSSNPLPLVAISIF